MSGNDLRAALRVLYENAGRPTYRSVAARGQLATMSVHQVLTGVRNRPTWSTVERLVTGLGDDPSEYYDLWVADQSGERDDAEA